MTRLYCSLLGGSFLAAGAVLIFVATLGELHAEERDPAVAVIDPAVAENLAALKEFQAAYDYDTAYLQKLAEDSPGAYEAFSQAEGMAAYRHALPLDAHYVARVATMLVEDCGPCTQLNLRMAVEAGVDRKTLDQLLHSPEQLPERLRDVRDHARAIVGEGEVTAERIDRLRSHYGDEGVAEIAVVVMGCCLYPTLKRAMLADEKCIVGELKY